MQQGGEVMEGVGNDEARSGEAREETGNTRDAWREDGTGVVEEAAAVEAEIWARMSLAPGPCGAPF
jgi:hypothetical protein